MIDFGLLCVQKIREVPGGYYLDFCHILGEDGWDIPNGELGIFIKCTLYRTRQDEPMGKGFIRFVIRKNRLVLVDADLMIKLAWRKLFNKRWLRAGIWSSVRKTLYDARSNL